METPIQHHIKSLLTLTTPSSRAKGILSKEFLYPLSQALLQLQRGLTGSRQYAGSYYMDEKKLLEAYLLYYWPVSYQQIRAILTFLKKHPALNNLHKEKIAILDIGSGPAPASAAICDFLINSLNIKEESISVTFTDHSKKALSLAQKLFEKDFPKIQIQTICCDFEKENPSIEGKKFSIVTFCHSLNEMWQKDESPTRRRTEFIEKITEYMEEKALLILCEPALTKSSRELIAVRDELLSKDTGLKLLSPCPAYRSPTTGSASKGDFAPCPALLQGENTTCHTEAEWEEVEPAATLAQMAGLDRNSIKMAYFVFQKTSQKDSPEKNEDAVSFTARVVSDQMLNKAGRIRFVLCDGGERFSFSAKKDDKTAGEKGFWKLKRGNLIRVKAAERRGDNPHPSFAITGETLIEILE